MSISELRKCEHSIISIKTAVLNLNMSSTEIVSCNNNQINNPSSHPASEHEHEIHFTPPLYRQRYKLVLDIIQQDSTHHSLLDIGCGTCHLLTIGKYRNPHIQLVAAIEIDQYQIEEASYRLKPLPVEYINFRRETPLHIYLLLGNALKRCQCFHDFDVVTLIEVIEHLYHDSLAILVENVFAYIRPRLVIVTTPNADFNVLFDKMTCGQFRHADHKFEFTREQFQFWAQQITLTYPYKVEFTGVGDAPLHEQHRNIGSCTQIAIFYRQEIHNRQIVTSNLFVEKLSKCNNHTLIKMIDYPHNTKKDTELHEQIAYILNMYRLMAEENIRHGNDYHDTYPLMINCEKLFNHPRLAYAQLTIDNCKEILQRLGYRIVNNHQIILSEGPPTSIDDGYHDNDYNYQSNSNQIQFQQQTSEESWD